MDIKWAKDSSEGNYDGAESFLSLTMNPNDAKRLVKILKEAPLSKFKAKDIMRASGLKPISESNDNVQKHLEKIRDEKEINPMILVRDEKNGKVVVADGYHRLSAIYMKDEDAWIQCKIV